MNWLTRSVIAAATIAGFGDSPEARAQYPAGRPGYTLPPPPSTSPYLNLLRPGNTAVNYYGLVRPETEFRNSIGLLQREVSGLAVGGEIDPVTGTSLLYSGHPVQFNNLSHYFGPGVTRGGFTARTPAAAFSAIRPGTTSAPTGPTLPRR